MTFLSESTSWCAQSSREFCIVWDPCEKTIFIFLVDCCKYPLKYLKNMHLCLLGILKLHCVWKQRRVGTQMLTCTLTLVQRWYDSKCFTWRDKHDMGVILMGMMGTLYNVLFLLWLITRPLIALKKQGKRVSSCSFLTALHSYLVLGQGSLLKSINVPIKPQLSLNMGISKVGIVWMLSANLLTLSENTNFKYNSCRLKLDLQLRAVEKSPPNLTTRG